MNFFLKKNINAWYKSILVRTALLSWILIIIAVITFILATLPYQQDIIEDRMISEANDIAGSVGQVTASAVINDDFGFIVDYCMKMVDHSHSIVYIEITRQDGYSLIFTIKGWSQKNIQELNLSSKDKATEGFQFSNLVNEEVFHYSYPFEYSAINWGKINVGLSLGKYNETMHILYLRTIFAVLFSILIGLFTSIYFAKKITKPITQLDTVSQQVANGDLKARVKIKMGNEFGRLANSFNKMADSLQNSQKDLEGKVADRTNELAKINKVLVIEIDEKIQAENTLKQNNIRLEALDKISRGIISAKSVEEIIKETINHLKKLFTSIHSAHVTLFSEHLENANIYSGDFNEDTLSSVSETEIKFLNSDGSSQDFLKEPVLVNNIKDSEKIAWYEEQLLEKGINSHLTAPLLMDEHPIGTITIGSRDTDAFNEEEKENIVIVANSLAVAINQAQLQEKINGHAKSLQSSLSEKEVLLKEIHHRVKNNLQVISSLLYLNSRKIKDPEALKMFKDSQNRVKSIALVHERLYQSKDLGSIDFKGYVERLTNDLFRSYGVNQTYIGLNINIKDISVSIDTAVPCGLIINELISNSLKYAFPDAENRDKKCMINIDFTKNGNNELQLVVSDNGIGMSDLTEEKKQSSLGLQLVDTLVNQLDGKIEIEKDNGTTFRIRLKDSIS